MRKTAILAALALAMVATATAHGGGHSDGAAVAEILENPDAYAEIYNNNTDRVPGLVRTLVTDRTVNVTITVNGTDHTFGVVMDGIRIDRIEEGGAPGASVAISTDAATLERILTAEDRPQAAVDAFNSGAISYRTATAGDGILFGIISGLMKVFGALL